MELLRVLSRLGLAIIIILIVDSNWNSINSFIQLSWFTLNRNNRIECLNINKGKHLNKTKRK